VRDLAGTAADLLAQLPRALADDVEEELLELAGRDRALLSIVSPGSRGDYLGCLEESQPGLASLHARRYPLDLLSQALKSAETVMMALLCSSQALL
jgi:hypothetical protein